MTNPSAKPLNNTENLQEKLTQKAYVHHDHGGHEHGRDWDNVPKEERKFIKQHEGKKKALELDRRGKDTGRSLFLKRNVKA